MLVDPTEGGVDQRDWGVAVGRFGAERARGPDSMMAGILSFGGGV